MKKFILSSVFILSLCLLGHSTKAWVFYSGYAFISWSGNPWTATSGTVRCSGPVTVLCCAVSGSSIAINMGGDWWYGTLQAPMNSADDTGVFTDEGLTRGESPE